VSINKYLKSGCTGNIRIGNNVTMTSSGGGTGWVGEVTVFADLPDVSTNLGNIYLVRTSTGFLWNRRKGFYRSNGTSWNRLSNATFEVLDNEANFSDNVDNTKKMNIELSAISTGTNRTIIMPDNDAEIGLIKKINSDIQPVNPNDNYDFLNGGLKDVNVTNAITLGDSINISVDSDFNNSSLIGVINENKKTFEDMIEPTGFINRIDSTISWSDSSPDRTFTISPVTTSFSFYQNSKKYTKTGSDSIQLTNTVGVWVIYYDSGVLNAINQPTNIQIEDIYLNKVLVAYVYWNTILSNGRLFEERHGCRMDGSTHFYLHNHNNLAYISGLALDNFTPDSSGDIDSHAQFSVDAGLVFDEDISLSISEVGTTIGLEIWYKSGSIWTWTTNPGFSILTTGTGRAAYNLNGTQVEVPSTNFVLCHVFVWNDVGANKVIAVQGQDQYTTLANARLGADNEITTLDIVELLKPEMRPLGTVIFQTANGYTNAVKSRVRSYDGTVYADFRLNPIGKWFI